MLPEYFYHTPKGKPSKIGFHNIREKEKKQAGL